MKFKCKICGQQIDNPYICPFCGSGSDHIILIDEEDEDIKEEVTEEKVDETYEYEPSCETNSKEDEDKVLTNDNSSNTYINKTSEVSYEGLNDSKLEHKDDNKTQVENEEKVLYCEKKPTELDYFLKIYGFLYLNNLELASKFKTYFDHYLLEKSLEAAKGFTEEDFKNFSSDDDFLNKIIGQFKL